jgi:hypothetical protein
VIETVEGDLDLFGMQLDDHDVVHAAASDVVRDVAHRDGLPARVRLVLRLVPEAGRDDGDATGLARPPERGHEAARVGE